MVSCLQEDELKKPFVSNAPAILNDGWTISSPENERIDAQKLAKIYADFHADQDIWQARSLMVFRNGKLLQKATPKMTATKTTPGHVELHQTSGGTAHRNCD
jgi:hypothetical protein